MEDRTGRLDLLLLGIVERLAARNPLTSTAFQVFEQDLREMFKGLNSPAVRKMVRSCNPAAAPAQRKKLAKTGVKRVKRITAKDKPVEVLEAEWVS